MGNIRNKESGEYNWSTIVLALILTGVLLWQGVFAALGGAEYVDLAEDGESAMVYVPDEGYMSTVEAFSMIEPFSASAGDGLESQRVTAWRNAVANPAVHGGVWEAFWANAPFGGGGSVTHHSGGGGTLASHPYVGSRFFCSRGIWWRVIAADGNNRLIMTEGGYNRGDWVRRRTAVMNWAAENLASELRAAMRVPNDASFWENTISTPGGASTANDSVFTLSEAEFNAYLGVASLTAARNARERPTAIPELRNGEHMWTHFNPAQSITSGHTQGWGLRTANASGRWVNLSGGVSSNATSLSGLYVRPALWIST